MCSDSVISSLRAICSDIHGEECKTVFYNVNLKHCLLTSQQHLTLIARDNLIARACGKSRLDVEVYSRIPNLTGEYQFLYFIFIDWEPFVRKIRGKIVSGKGNSQREASFSP